MPKGIYPRPSPATRFWRHVDKSGPSPEFRPDLGPCWLWTASLTQGGVYRSDYPRFSIKGKDIYAHRFSYELLVGQIPEGLELDHLCRVRHCVNPSHLEPVTQQVNTLRGFTSGAISLRTDLCGNGHDLSGENAFWHPGPNGYRGCRICHRANGRRTYARHRQAPEPRPCERCGTVFTPKRRDGRFCSRSCQRTGTK